MKDLPEGNLLNRELPALQQAVVNSIWRKVEIVGVKYGFEVTTIQRFDKGRRLEVGVMPTGASKLTRGLFIGVKVEGRSVAEIGQELANGFEDWAKQKLGISA